LATKILFSPQGLGSVGFSARIRIWFRILIIVVASKDLTKFIKLFPKSKKSGVNCRYAIKMLFFVYLKVPELHGRMARI
jgi:hypothetical protein